ncbi:magnesium transporter CorA family protein [Actimicrobium sp. CCC2.4]|uniref:magnesium transporter CorA family protein n=1 Tax=Actimicrobium sp. CCC2.4 TaxID=3048606 RepID=UPI002AC8A4A1|nr:magnesium transporter CorA family protein [Actimicrobium sp. CCC2.4]MEB0135455.1 magnesium transporter CorA family protein [Actimicrobium sp. CCC2.4]WPX32371.1 magnesium transporter CorA family protein [Actimicrobium sp. CCC2.4]
MDIFHISSQQATMCSEAPLGLPADGFLWVDTTREEIADHIETWRDEIERISGVAIYDLHLTDIMNLTHSSYFDSTNDYEMVVFRKLRMPTTAGEAANKQAQTESDAAPSTLRKLVTQPVIFIVMDRLVITVHAENSTIIRAARTKLLEYRDRGNTSSRHGRLPTSPQEWMLRLLNTMVDQYLDLRQPLTTQIDRWQRALLNPRRPFNDWIALLDARIALRKLDHLCEEQHDALQELRDHIIDTYRTGEDGREKDLLLVRTNDVIEHIGRVLGNARRLESSLESAVQMHFSAMSHRTSEIMRTLTVITALFMPLTLITGIFGMNFEVMPLLKDKIGFWLIMGAMAMIVVGLLAYFRRKHYLEG